MARAKQRRYEEAIEALLAFAPQYPSDTDAERSKPEHQLETAPVKPRGTRNAGVPPPSSAGNAGNKRPQVAVPKLSQNDHQPSSDPG